MSPSDDLSYGNRKLWVLFDNNLQWAMPTKIVPTLRVIAMPAIDRLALNHLLVDLECVEERVNELEKMIVFGVSGRQCETISTCQKIGELLGARTRLQQQRRKRSAPGQHHKSRQYHPLELRQQLRPHCRTIQLARTRLHGSLHFA
jgi:hypothetical protein